MEEKQGWAEKPSEACLSSDLSLRCVRFPGAAMCPFRCTLFTSIMLPEVVGLLPISQMEKLSLENETTVSLS